MTVPRSRRTGAWLGAAAAGALLVSVAGCGGGSVGSATPARTSLPSGGSTSTVPATPAGTPTAELEVLDFKLDPADLTVSQGSISIAVVNGGPTLHNVTIRDDAGTVLGATPDLREGEGATLQATLGPGTYILFCSLPGHESLGIKGTLTVTGS